MTKFETLLRARLAEHRKFLRMKVARDPAWVIRSCGQADEAAVILALYQRCVRKKVRT